MIIERLDLIAFGQFTGTMLDLSAGPKRFHIVYGPNESGKSTSMRAIHSLLFGMPLRSDDNFIHTYSTMRVGGQFRDVETGDVIQCVRRRGKTKTLMNPDESEEVDPSRLAAMLRGIDAETFSRQFGISHNELVAGGRAILEGGGDLGEMLFAAGTGTGTLRAARTQLEKDRRELFIERGSTATINKLISRFTETDKQLRDCRLLPIQYDSKYKELDQAILDAEKVEHQLISQTQSYRLLKAYFDAQALLPDRQDIVYQLNTSIGSAPLLDDDFIANRRQIENKRQSTLQQLETYRDQATELTLRRDTLKIDRPWIEISPTVKSLMNELSEILAGQKQYERFEKDLVDIDSQITSSVQRLGRITSDAFNRSISANGPQVDQLDIPDSVRNEIDSMVTRYGGLIESIQLIEENIASLQQSRSTIAERLATIQVAPDVTPLVNAIADVGKPRVLIDNVALYRDEERKAFRAVNESLATLRGFSGTVDDARQYLPPPDSKVDELSNAISQAKVELHQCETTVEKLRDKLKESQAIYQEFVCDSDLPTADQRDEARRGRDSIVTELQDLIRRGESVDARMISSLKEHIRLVDQITDQLHRAHDQVVQHQRLSDDVAKSQTQLDLAIESHQTAVQSLAQATTAWNELWTGHQVVAGTPDEMRVWLSNLAALKKTISSWDEKVASVSSAESAVQRAVEQLLATLRVVETSEGADLSSHARLDLTEVYSMATLRKENVLKKQNESAQCEDELNRADTAITKLCAELKKHERQHQQWQTRWQELLAQFALTSQVRPENIHGIIRQIDEIQTLRQRRDSLAESTQLLQTAYQNYRSRVEAVATQLKLELTEQDLAHFVRQVAHQSDEQQHCENERKLLNQQIETLHQRIRTACDEEKSLLAQLQCLCREAGVADVDQLPAIEQASARRRQLERDLQAINQQLRTLAASEPLDDFILQALQQDVPSLEIDISKAETEIKRLQERWTVAQQAVGKLRGEVEQMDASDKAAIVQQERQNLLAAIRRHVNRYAELTIADEALKRAIEHYRQANEGPVLRLASTFFNRLTGGEYECLRIEFDDKDQPKLFGVRPDAKTTVMSNLMSDGTADALYLSLRLASLEVHLDSHNPIPLIVDDCLVQFDDDRAAAALRIFSDMSIRTQVILFTHHQHMLDLAIKNLPNDGFHSHRLDKRFVAQSFVQA